MAASLETTKTDEKPIYKFRFGTSKNVAQLTECQLERIPYLASLVAHVDDFSTDRNEYGEYVLSSRFPYTWFMAILRSLTKKQPFFLFTKLTCRTTVLGMLALYEYLSVDPIPVPLLKNENLVRSHSTELDDKTKRIRYHQASLSEARNTAAEFVIALSKEEYDLHDFHTKQRIFALIIFIVEHSNIFGLRFCHHTLTVTRNYCFPSFSRSQQSKLKIIRRHIQHKIGSKSRPNDGSEALSAYLQIAFSWRGVYEPMSNDDMGCISTTVENTSSRIHFLDILPSMSHHPLNRFYTSPFEHYHLSPHFYAPLIDLRSIFRDLPLIEPCSNELSFIWNDHASLMVENLNSVELYKYLIKEERKKKKALSTRYLHFNTSSKRPTADKFKHKIGPKAKKY